LEAVTVAETQLAGVRRQVDRRCVQLVYSDGRGVGAKGRVGGGVTGGGSGHPGGLRAAGHSGPAVGQSRGGHGVEILGEETGKLAKLEGKSQNAEICPAIM